MLQVPRLKLGLGLLRKWLAQIKTNLVVLPFDSREYAGSSMGSFLPDELLLSLNNQIPCREPQIRQVGALLDVSLRRVRLCADADVIVAQSS